jgi:ABC-type transporter Mla MlaB component
MRTIVFEEPYSVTIRVEGDLTAEAARELSSRVTQWREMTAEKKMRLDLGDVGSVDAQGAAWLRDLSERGVGFTAMSPAVHRVATSFARETKEDLRSWLARIGIRLSAPPASERMGFFRRIICAILPQGTAGCPCER